MRINCPGCDYRFRIPDDDDDRRVTCPECGERFRPSDLEDDEEEERPTRKAAKSSKGRRHAPPKTDNSKTVLLIAVAGGAGLLLVGGIVAALVWFSVGNSKVAKGPMTEPYPPGRVPPPQPTFPLTPNQPGPAFNPQPPVNSPPTPPVFNPQPPVFTPPTNPSPVRPNPVSPNTAELDELFRLPVDANPPVIRMAVLSRKVEDTPLTVPTFHSLMVANKLVKPSAQTRLTLEEVKQATVYIKVDAGELSGSGSGFYIGAENGVALVATNHHVIEAAAKVQAPGVAKSKITCVFNSGVNGDERPSLARVVAVDPVADLAVLRLDNPPAKPPKPINPWATPKLTETMDVRIFGFPFGEQLSTATTNPNISVNNGTVSSLRLKKSGGLETVQITGAINPGNSGGPIVDKDGRLVGVAVSTIKGSGLGFAVPVDELIGLLEGKILFTEFVPTGLDRTAAKFKVVVPVMDPRAKVQTVYVRYWAGKGAKPQAVKDAQYGHKPIANGQEVALKLPDGTSSLAVAVADLALPADATDVVLQLGSEQVPAPGQARGMLSISAPVEYKLGVKEISTGSDAKPLSEVFRDLDSLAGRTVIARGKMVRPPMGVTLEKYEPVVVADVTGRVPVGVRFLMDVLASPQFDEIAAEVRGNDVRLVCVVGKKGADGVIPVRVARCDFLGDGEVVTRSVPEADTTDTLAALNRDTFKFNGKSITVVAAAALQSSIPRPGDSFSVRFTNMGYPRSVTFAYAPGLMKKVSDLKLKPNGYYRVRLTGSVKAETPRGMGVVSVTRVEILDPNDESVQKLIE